jgi:hypothetical protein
MQAVTAVYPGITVILYPHTGWRSGLDYELLGPFADGLLEGLGPAATLVDSGQAYQYRTYDEFVALKEKARTQGQRRSAAPALHARVQQALGLWVDYECDAQGEFAGWRLDPAEYHRNYRPPHELEHALHNALTVSDRYVWLFVWHGAAWWAPGRFNIKACPLCPHPDGPFPNDYADAFRNCRKPHPLDWEPARRKRIYSPEDLLLMGPDILSNGGMEKWLTADLAPLAWQLGGQGPSVARHEAVRKEGRRAALLNTVLQKGHVFLDQRLDATPYRGRTITFGAWLRDEYDLGHVQILDFVNDRHESSAISSEWSRNQEDQAGRRTYCLSLGSQHGER